jgi:hypothetical protein
MPFLAWQIPLDMAALENESYDLRQRRAGSKYTFSAFHQARVHVFLAEEPKNVSCSSTL